MNRRSCLTSISLLLGGLLAGVALGVLIGWVLWPVHYIDTDIVDLRAGYQDDYILMVSDAYYLDRDLALAQQRLENLADASVTARIVALIKGKMAAGEPPERLASMVALARGLRLDSQDMLDYVVTSTLPAMNTPKPPPTLTATPTSVTVAAETSPEAPDPTTTPLPSPTVETTPSPVIVTEELTREVTLSAPGVAVTGEITAVLPVLTAEPVGEVESRPLDFAVMKQRMMSKVEVGGCDAPAMIYVKTVDPKGGLVDGVVVQAFWDGGKFEPVVTGSKGPGTAEIVASSGDYYVEIVGNVGGEELTSERSRLLRTSYPSVDDLLDAGYCESVDAKGCESLRDHNALCGGHYSYELYFKRSW